MNILFTGASSFTGFWFIHALVDRGHRVSAIFQRSLGEYEGVRKKRIEILPKSIEKIFNCSFGSSAFIELIQRRRFDLCCHHAAQVQDYQSPEFDCVQALRCNTNNLLQVLENLKENGCSRIVLSGSIFEPFEGGEKKGEAHSLYGLSKGLTSQVFNAYARSLNMKLAKFVIPNPFGPLEEYRFTSYLAHSWLTQKMPILLNPMNVCDNIPVDLLSNAYVQLVESEESILRPTGYVETQNEFAARFAKEMQERFAIPCPLQVGDRSNDSCIFNRFNNQKPACRWEEKKFWDRLAQYYLETWGKHR